MILYLDTETYSTVPIKHGTHAYAAAAEIMLVPYAIDEGEPQVWDCTADPLRAHAVPDDLWGALENPECKVVIHNSYFDRTVMAATGFYDLPPERIHDTMVQALAHSLPAGLGDLCTVLGVPAEKAKDKRGRQLIQLFCKPLGKNRALDRATRNTHPVEWEEFKEYAASDIRAMRECYKRMPTVNLTEFGRRLWLLDQEINDRGVAIDMALVKGAIEAVEQAQKDLRHQTQELTDGAVMDTSTTARLRAYIEHTFGVFLPNLQMATVEKMLAQSELDDDLVQLLTARLAASSTSTSKYKALGYATSADNRLRGTLQFCGASRTGRWAGRTFQPQNLPRPTLKQSAIDAGISAIKAGCTHLVVPNIMELASSAIRGCIVAPPGKKLVIADLSNIEGRVQAWLAREEWKLKAFRDFDTGTGPDLYKLAYGKSFGVRPEDVTKDQRQVGKVQELALGYAGGVGAFSTFAAAYGISLDDLAAKVLPLAPRDILAEARSFLGYMIKKGDLAGHQMSDDAFVACDALKRMWRTAHPAITAYWQLLSDLVIKALVNRGETFEMLGIRARATAKAWLYVTMPSGRALCYPAPRLTDVDGKQELTYKGVNQYTRKWDWIKTHGGKLFENLCQAAARDVLAEGMMRAERSGYRIVLHVHDELICEVPDSSEFTVDGLAACMSAPPHWAPDMPLSAAGFETYRYKKE